MEPVTLTEAELNARLLRIRPVSWQWNAWGLIIHLFSRDAFKPWNRREEGVIAQEARDHLGDAYPDITKSHRGVLRVNYGLLANLLCQNLRYLDQLRGETTHGDPGSLNLQDALEDAVNRDDAQASVVKLLLLTRNYNERIDNARSST